MSKLADWLAFATRVRNHIRDYVIPQYGDKGEDPSVNYTEEDCIKHAQRYLARFGKQSRKGEELLDLYKAAHWIQIAAAKMEENYRLPDPIVKAEDFEDTNFANAPMSITEIRGEKTNNGSTWTVRDAMISALRDMDRGELVADICVLCFGRITEGGLVETKSYQRSGNRYEYWGLLTEVMNRRTVKDAQE